MKKTVCALLTFAMLLSLAACGNKNKPGEDAKFSELTVVYEGLYLGMTEQEATSVLGNGFSRTEPTDEEVDNFLYGHYFDLDYPELGLSLRFYDVDKQDLLVLGEIALVSEKAEMPCGLKVGGTYRDILNVFYDDGKMRDVSDEIGSGYLYYLYGNDPLTEEERPEYSQYAVVNHLYSDSDINYVQMYVSELAGGYYDSFCLVFTCTNDGAITKIDNFHVLTAAE